MIAYILSVLSVSICYLYCFSIAAERNFFIWCITLLHSYTLSFRPCSLPCSDSETLHNLNHLFEQSMQRDQFVDGIAFEKYIVTFSITPVRCSDGSSGFGTSLSFVWCSASGKYLRGIEQATIVYGCFLRMEINSLNNEQFRYSHYT